MLKITPTGQTVNSSAHLICCFDVSKRSLSLYAEYQADASSCRVEDEIPNRTGAIESLLGRLADLACEAGLDGLTVCAEATGGYERKLLHTARRLGHQTALISPETALISPEHVAKLKAVESNDTGKTDHKDPRVMHLVARLGKTQAHRHLPAIYRRLRRLTAYYDEDEQVLAATRQRIQAVTEDLFPDYDKPATFTFGSTGEALMEAYAFNPYHIVRAGYTRFKKTMKRRVNARFATLEHLFACAEASIQYAKTETEVELLVERLRQLWADYERLTARRARLRAEIERLGARLEADGDLPEADGDLPEADGDLPRLTHLKGITRFNLARLAGQTGPLRDFHSGRALLRYAGLNLRERQSGTYRWTIVVR
ncbi:MAG: transposase [Bacteroidetes bacterium]|jgi:transposase|nr:transposase [Bacteroidota bacterium]